MQTLHITVYYRCKINGKTHLNLSLLDVFLYFSTKETLLAKRKVATPAMTKYEVA